MNFKKLIKQVRSASKSRDRAQEILDKEQAVLRAGLETLTHLCRPFCIEAAEKYNIGKSLKIVTRDIKLSFNLQNRKVFLLLCLRSENGHEPDEDFDEPDLKKIESNLGPEIDRLFAKEKISLVFGGVSVPSSYYPK